MRYRFGTRSLENLLGVHPELAFLAWEILKERDIYIASGVRTVEEQAALYEQGRTKPGVRVTNIDGERRRSDHQVDPLTGFGHALDFVPWPEKWSSVEAFDEIAEIGFEIIRAKGLRIGWGGHWTRFVDRPHWYVLKD